MQEAGEDKRQQPKLVTVHPFNLKFRMPPFLLLLSLYASLNLTPSLALIPHVHDRRQQSPIISSPSNQLSRSTFFQWLGGAGVTLLSPTLPVFAFEGGVGGLGKTKPQTGVELWDSDSTPFQNTQGIVSAEIASSSGKPILVNFQTPWPLSTVSSGLEARDLRTSESAFVQVLPLDPKIMKDWQTPANFRQLLLESLLASQGKYGAYGSPTDVKVKALKDTSTFQVTFISYTPSMLESERQLWIEPKAIDNDTLVLLVVGTTRPRFATQQATIQKVVDSFTAVAAPTTRMRKRKEPDTFLD
jgi:hypothetical protein